jgi:hypothetical protein
MALNYRWLFAMMIGVALLLAACAGEDSDDTSSFQSDRPQVPGVVTQIVSLSMSLLSINPKQTRRC